MPDTVPATFELDPETAAALDDPATPARVERVIRRPVRPGGIERLFASIAALKADAHQRGPTDELVDEEFAAYKAERRNSHPA